MGDTAIRYRHLIHDSARFDDFEFRDGDIIISTPPKCGTTWTQTICALLIFGTPDLPKPVDLLSPWLEQSLRPLSDVVADLAAQTHRRFIKSHTPLDGLPWDDRVTYICVGRDPRDVAMSWDNHLSNMDIPKLFELRDKAVGNADLAELMPDPSVMLPPELESDRFWEWVARDDPLTETVVGLAFTLHHFASFYDQRDRPNIVMLHYGDLLADLEGQMRALAARLGIEVPEDRWDSLIQAATFGEMRKNPAAVAPNSTENIWVDRDRFFNKGTSGQWAHLLADEESQARYRSRVDSLASPELSAWAHQGTA